MRSSRLRARGHVGATAIMRHACCVPALRAGAKQCRPAGPGRQVPTCSPGRRVPTCRGWAGAGFGWRMRHRARGSAALTCSRWGVRGFGWWAAGLPRARWRSAAPGRGLSDVPSTGSVSGGRARTGSGRRLGRSALVRRGRSAQGRWLGGELRCCLRVQARLGTRGRGARAPAMQEAVARGRNRGAERGAVMARASGSRECAVRVRRREERELVVRVGSEHVFYRRGPFGRMAPGAGKLANVGITCSVRRPARWESDAAAPRARSKLPRCGARAQLVGCGSAAPGCVWSVHASERPRARPFDLAHDLAARSGIRRLPTR